MLWEHGNGKIRNNVAAMMTRHFIDVGIRRVHYRVCGSGPPLLMVHRSPRSSGEYDALMRDWGRYFTCIAPDTPGFGQSDPLGSDAEIDDFANALVAFLDALEIPQCAAYGCQSGGSILVSALLRYPARFSGLAVSGYAVWTDAERAAFGPVYLPVFKPLAYGEHMTWLWNRVLEQHWFFPWFDTRNEMRLPGAHDDPAYVHAIAMDMIDAGDAYRVGYGAALRARNDLAAAVTPGPPVLIMAHDGDPLQSHIDRLATLPANWSARKVATQAEHDEQSLAFLQAHAAPPIGALPSIEDEGFAHIACDGFDGLIHWAGLHTASRLQLHAPGGEVKLGQALAIDLPGHGLSDDWIGTRPERFEAWQSFVNACRTHFGIRNVDGLGWSAALGNREAARPTPEMAARLIPDLTPDRFGSHLTRAWSVARAQRLFDPWYQADVAHGRDVDPVAGAPDAIARDARALLRARSGRALLKALSES